MNKRQWTGIAMSRCFAKKAVSPDQWFCPTFPCLRKNVLTAIVIPFERTPPQDIPGYVLVPKVVCYIPFPAANPIEVVAFDPRQFDMVGEDANKILSTLEMPSTLKHGEFTEITVQLNEALSRGFENGYFMDHSLVTSEERADSKLIAELLPRITPIGLDKLYHSAGKMLYDWIDRCR